MKKMKKKIIGMILLPVMLMSSCAQSSTDERKADVKVWTADINEKILQDNLELYEDYNDKALNIFAAKNEKESGQIVITAKEGSISEYTVETSNLITAEGEVFSRENIELFHVKYKTVTPSGKEYYKIPGMYPEVMLPYETAVEYGENEVKMDNNQTIMVRFDVPLDQPAGTYEGSIKVNTDGKTETVPVSLKVYDIEVSEEVHSKSAFSLSWDMEMAEFDESMEMRLNYADFMGEYMVSGFDIMPGSYYTSDSEIEDWTELVAIIWENPKISTIRFPSLNIVHDSIFNLETGDEYNNMKGMDYELSSKIMTSLAEKCLEDNKNYLNKIYIRGVDEPAFNGQGDDTVIAFHYTGYMMKELVKTNIEKMRTEANTEFVDELLNTLDKIPIVSTDNNVTEEKKYLTYCPYYSKLHNEEARDKYQRYSYNEVWWYGCNVPTNPYPNYHVDDSLLSARLLSWMQYDYNVIGNLYWAVDSYGAPIYDYYDFPTTIAQGEGVLVYPGKPYGVDGPIASLRLDAIRDGLEEYEILRAVGEKYEALGYSFDSIMDVLSNYLYDGTQVAYDLEFFNDSRKNLYQLAELANDKAGNFLVTDIKEENGEYNFAFYAKAGCEVKVGGKTLSPKATVNGGCEYQTSVRLANGVTGLDVEVTYEQSTQMLSLYLGAAANLYDAEQLQSGVKAYVAAEYGIKNTVETTLIDASALGLEGEDKYLQLKLAESKIYQGVSLSGDKVQTIGLNTKTVIITLYFDGEEEETKMIYVGLQYKNNPSDYDLKQEVQLKAGLNRITLNNVFSYNWLMNGALDSIYLGFSKDTQATELTSVYLKDIAVFDK